MDGLDLLIDLHRNAKRQGPGGDEETRRAIALARLDRAEPLRIADIGCGTGAASLVLATELDASITAVDLLPEFLAELEAAAAQDGLGERITAVQASMDALPFEDAQFDAIWSEGAIYNTGFANGVASWRRFLKPGGILAVSELTWLTKDRPAELQDHWMEVYPEVGTAARKMTVLEENGYAPLGYFVLPRHCWIANYYTPMRNRFQAFLDRNGNSSDARAIVDSEEAEIALYEAHSEFVGYGFYIAQRTSSQ